MKYFVYIIFTLQFTGCFAGGETPRATTSEIMTNEKYDTEDIRCVIDNKNTKLIVLYKLSRHPNYSVRAMIAMHNQAPKELLNSLAFDENWLVRLEAVCNKNIDDEIKNYVVQNEKDSRFKYNYDSRLTSR